MTLPLRPYLQLLGRYLRPQLKWSILLAFLLLIVLGLKLANPQILRGFIDAAERKAELSTLLSAGGVFLAFAFVVQVLSVVSTYLSERVGWTATNWLRADLALHALKLDMTFHNDKTPGEMIERIDGDVMDLAIFFSQMVVQMLGNVLLLIGVLIALTIEDWRVGLALTAFGAVALFALARMRQIAVPHWKTAREAHADLYGYIEERLSGTEDIRSSGGVAYVMRGLYEAARKTIRAESKAGVIGVTVWLVWQFGHVMGRAVAFIASYFLYTQGNITLGTAYLIVYYTEVIFGPLARLTQEMEQFQKTAGSIERLRDLQKRVPKLTDTGTATLPKATLGVAFQDVTFGYNSEQLILKGVTFAIAPGRVLGVLGRTGSGKTTVARLIYRLYDVSGGCVSLTTADTHINVRDVPLKAIPERVAMVTQDVQIFRSTVRNNLTLFDPAIPDARVLEVIQELGMSEWLGRQKNGLDAELESGGKGLSAGEAQLLAFARAFLRDPGLIVMDEASSRLDPATEARIEHAIEALLEPAPGKKRSALIIAHRLDTVMRADDILILDEGRVAEYGAREALQRDPNSRFSTLLRTADIKAVLA